MDFPEDILKKVLARVHDLIIPSLINPLLLAGRAGAPWAGRAGRRCFGVCSLRRALRWRVHRRGGRALAPAVQGQPAASTLAGEEHPRVMSLNPSCPPRPDHSVFLPARPDFLTATLDKGGLSGMLALNGIFLLVTRHGLEYPRFYARLYQLLTPDAFHVSAQPCWHVPRRAGGTHCSPPLAAMSLWPALVVLCSPAGQNTCAPKLAHRLSAL